MTRHTGNRSRLIWDGYNTGITDQHYFYTCLKCGEKNQHQVMNLIEVGATSGDRPTKWMLKKTCCLEMEMATPLQAVFRPTSTCHACSTSHYILLGLKETQPQRYKIYQKSVITTDLTGGGPRPRH